MTPADKPEFLKRIIGLAAVKPGKPLTEEAYEIWWSSLEHWEFEDFKKAAAHLAICVEFMPSPYHFEQLRKAAKPTAGEAWARIREMARRSFEGTPEDPIAARALQALGGLRTVAMCDSDKVHFLERRFAEHYEAMGDADTVRTALPELTQESTDGLLNLNVLSLERRLSERIASVSVQSEAKTGNRRELP